MHRADIVAAVKKKGSTLRAVSLAAGLSPSAAGVALLFPFKSAEDALIQFLAIHPHTLWPDRYAPGGQRYPRRRRTKAEIARGDPLHRDIPARAQAKGQRS